MHNILTRAVNENAKVVDRVSSTTTLILLYFPRTKEFKGPENVVGK